LNRDVIRHQAGTVIVCLGGNDILRQMPVDGVINNLDQILSRTQASGAMVVLVGVQGLPVLSTHRSRYRDLAKRHGAILVPNILGGIIGNRKLMADQIHPNSEGYAMMADRVAEALRPHLLP
jgi:lysophospholipase L1-like esterase